MWLLNPYGFLFQLYLGLVASLGVIVTMASVPALPSITERFSCHAALSGWTVTSAVLGVLLCQFFWGPFSDRWGRAWPLFIGCLLTALASFLCYMAPDIATVLVGRFMQGFASGVGTIVVRALCRDIYKGPQLNKMIAWVLTVIPFSAGVVPSLGDVLISHYGWNAPFMFLTAYALVMAGLVPVFLKNSWRAPKRQQVGTVYQVVQNCRSFMKSKLTTYLTFVSASIFCCYFIFIPSSPWIFHNFFGLDGRWFSLSLFVFPFGTFCGGTFQSFWGWQFDPDVVSQYAALFGVSLLVLDVLFVALFSSVVLYILCITLFGACMAILNAVYTSKIMECHPAHCSGNLSSFLGVFQNLGSVIGSLVAGYMLFPLPVLLSLLAILCFALSWGFFFPNFRQVPKETVFESA